MAGTSVGIFKRPWIGSGQNLPMTGFAGCGWLANPDAQLVATDAAQTMTTNQMASGAVVYTSLSAGRVVTTPTAALIIAAMGEDFNIGDTYVFAVSCVAAFAVTWAAGVGVTLQGSATVEASTWSFVLVKKTSATTVNWLVL